MTKKKEQQTALCLAMEASVIAAQSALNAAHQNVLYCNQKLKAAEETAVAACGKREAMELAVIAAIDARDSAKLLEQAKTENAEYLAQHTEDILTKLETSLMVSLFRQ